ncbi:hypothetical protein DEO72_LG10g2265 [Vigna unguiculata]|uniref:GRF-type domain-containing protein n=1 Tax=Vigna unguiculata TaxID=3917 RepID=A0A4D6NDQ0_VIGUN|nr:hypothetical protein DEO72_LG10g2265 [Vigna unguiculata]
MNPANCGSCGSCSSLNLGGKQNSSVNFCSASGCRSVNITPSCYCGDKVVLRTTKTAKNKGKRFWGCPNFKYRIGEGGSASTIVIEDKCCGYVKNEQKVGGNVKIEEHVVGGSFNSQEMTRSYVMS